MSDYSNKIADLYIRVSTDEQAEKGYSQRNQEEMLRRYCVNQAIDVRNIIFEDHSAKSFNRPEWKKLIASLRKNRNRINLVLFTKWDRFSRNAGDAYQMIGTLRNLGVEPQAIEQPLDLSIPENKMMLAFYLAAPEVENDRRSLNVFYGMRRAKKEGRYMGLAPVGYGNRVDEQGKKYIVTREPDASIIRWAFECLAKGQFNTEQVYKEAKRKGLKCSKGTFWSLIRNPVYCGKIFIPAFQDEKAYFVQGQHQAIISEELYEKVQEVIDGRSRSYRSKIIPVHEFPLRGFFVCPKCGKVLTGSKSKGRNRYYAYYHCYGGCNYRISNQKLHDAFQKELDLYHPRADFLPVYRQIITETYHQLTAEAQLERKKLKKQREDYRGRITNISDLLATGQITPADYKKMNSRYSSHLEHLDEQLKKMANKTPPIEGLHQLDTADLLRLDKLMALQPTAEIRQVLGLLFPEKLCFHENNFENPQQHQLIRILYHKKNNP